MKQSIDAKTVISLFKQFQSIVAEFMQLSYNINSSLLSLIESIRLLSCNLDAKMDKMTEVQLTIQEVESTILSSISTNLDKKFSELNIKGIRETLKSIEQSIQVYNYNLQLIQELSTQIKEISVCKEHTVQKSIEARKEVILKVLGIIAAVLGSVAILWKIAVLIVENII